VFGAANIDAVFLLNKGFREIFKCFFQGADMEGIREWLVVSG
jgi:hypothetical protein